MTMSLLLRTVLTLATLSSLSDGVAASQEIGVIHIKAFLAGAGGKTLPVPRHALLISDNPPSSTPRRVFTSLDGAVDVQLRPGNYTIESDKPFAFEGKGYQWTQIVNVVAGRDAVLELTADNAEIAPLTAETTTADAPRDPDSSSLLAQWQASVIELWSSTSHASGFVIDPKGLVVTNQQAVGGAVTVEAQVTPTVKVAARVLATDPQRDVAVLWLHPETVASLRPVPLRCGEQTNRPIVKDQEVIAIEAALGQPKDTTSGEVESIATRAIMSDLTVGNGGAGGPVFTVDGSVVGLTSAVDDRIAQRRGETRIVRIGDVCEVIAAAEKNMKDAVPPSAAPLPVEPAKPYPVDALKDAMARRTGNLNPYQIPSPDFDVSFLTPVLNYAAQQRLEQRGQGARGGDARPVDMESALRRLLLDFGNWSNYVAAVPPVLLVRVTPKLVESFWTKVARGAAQTQGVQLPPLKRFRSGFSSMRAYCGDAEITPVHPFKIEHRVSDSDSVYEGLYVFDPDALRPECGTVKLVLYSEKEPEKGTTHIVDAKVVKQIWQDFEPYRALR
jgi:S1-C subfamily serine protease